MIENISDFNAIYFNMTWITERKHEQSCENITGWGWRYAVSANLALQKESRIIKYLTTKIVIKHNCFGENFFLWENLNSIFPKFFYPFI